MAYGPVDALSSDEELACQAQRGCTSSLDRLLRKFQGPLLHFLRHRGAGSDAEDLLQETFLRAYRNLHRYDRQWSFSAWLFTIARRISINHHRAARATKGDQGVDFVASATPEPWRALAAEEDRKSLWSLAAETLSEEQTTALWLYYVEELPICEIALVLTRSQSSVKVLLFRARRKLLPLVQAMDDETRWIDKDAAVASRSDGAVPLQAAMEMYHG
jgi:RNA polymerase sigma-70 factor (ECF subfamily)